MTPTKTPRDEALADVSLKIIEDVLREVIRIGDLPVKQKIRIDLAKSAQDALFTKVPRVRAALSQPAPIEGLKREAIEIVSSVEQGAISPNKGLSDILDKVCEAARLYAQGRTQAVPDHLFPDENGNGGLIQDLCYTAWDNTWGKEKDWINDTRPIVLSGIEKIKAMLSAAPTPPVTGSAWQLQWSNVSEPNDYCYYNHCFADTPLGRIQIEWKAWKDYPSFVTTFPWNTMTYGGDLEEAKLLAENEFFQTIKRCIPPQPESEE